MKASNLSYGQHKLLITMKLTGVDTGCNVFRQFILSGAEVQVEQQIEHSESAIQNKTETNYFPSSGSIASSFSTFRCLPCS